MDYPSLFLSMKSILMYEKLTGKNFSEFDSEEDMLSFMYCVFVCSTDMKITVEVFYTMLEGKKFAAWIGREFKRIWGYNQQFNKAAKGVDPSNSGETNTITMTEYINTLILEYGLDIGYMMNKMEMWEMEALYDAATAHFRNTMEDKRLWAYIQMLPNFDRKHRNMKPEKFIPFPWEAEETKKKIEKTLEAETTASKGILGMDINVILGKKEDNGTGRTNDNS